MGLSLPIFTSGPNATAPLAVAPHDHARLIDSHGRTIRDLRLSITDKCNFRCTYCMEPDVRFMPADQTLSVDEMLTVAAACVSLGVTKIRITGGEPTLHPQLTQIIRGLAALDIDDLAMTTNGSVCDAESLRQWRDAGLTRLTFSIDSLDPTRFAAMTRSRTTPAQVIAAIAASQRAGFAPVKVNAVVVRGQNEMDIVPLARLAQEMGFEMRFIEFMPLDSAHAWDQSKLVPAAEIVERIQAALPLREMGKPHESSTALIYEFADSSRDIPGQIGVIAPVTRPFCGACSRLRITADGKVRPCLFSVQEFDLRPTLRGTCHSPESLKRMLIDSTWTKQPGHGIATSAFVQPARPMSAIGG